MRSKTKKGTIMLILVMIACLLSIPLKSQEQNGKYGGLFGTEDHTESFGLLGRGGSSLYDGFSLQNFGEDGNDLTLQTFGEEVPIGSGMLILIAAGIGYAKRKTSIKTNDKKEN